MSRKESNVGSFLRKMRGDFAFRTFVFAALSICATVLFAGYNFVLGMLYGAAWNVCIGVYFSFLALLRAYVFFAERRIEFSPRSREDKERAKARAFAVQSAFLFVLDLALIAPISLMVLEDKSIEYSAIPAIAVAAYTAYRVTLSARNFFKARRQENRSVKMLRDISLMDALVSVLSLQYTLVMTFGEGVEEGGMLPLCAASSFGVWAFLVAFSVRAVIVSVRGIRGRREKEE